MAAWWVPRAIEKAAVEAALTKLAAERKTLASVEAGRSLGEVFAEFGVL